MLYTKSYNNLIEMFDEMSKKIPNNIAVICSEVQVTYKEIYDRSILISNKLLDLGMKPNDIIGVMLGRSVEIIPIMIGILRIGATLLPIDKDYPEERIKYIINNSKCNTLFTDKEDITYDVNVLDARNMYDQNGTNNYTNKFIEEITPDNIAYVIYTSGSTGNPKGVMLSHQAIIAFIDGISRLIEFSQGKKILAVATISFDLSIFELIVSLTQGMSIVLAEEHIINSSRMLLEYIKDKEVDILQMTPSRMSLLLESSRDYRWLDGISEILLGGDRLPERLLDALKSYTKARIYNLYGPTETTIYCTGHEMTNEDNITVGKPFYGTHIYILDEQQKEIDKGMSGEIYIGGPQLAKGYISNYELTQNSFINKNERLYKSGDIGKIDNDGNLVILGRSDDQVKIRGFRVEANEVAEVLIKHEKVKQAVVVPKKGKNESTYLCAYYVGDEEISAQEFRLFLKRFLAYYMIPDEYIRLDKFPKTSNYKIDKKKLTMAPWGGGLCKK